MLEADHGLIPVIALAPTLTLAQLREEGGVNLDGIRVIEGDTYSIVAASELALAASGTRDSRDRAFGLSDGGRVQDVAGDLCACADTGARSRFHRDAQYPGGT